MLYRVIGILTSEKCSKISPKTSRDSDDSLEICRDDAVQFGGLVVENSTSDRKVMGSSLTHCATNYAGNDVLTRSCATDKMAS